MFILGVGAAHPDCEVSDEFLASVGLAPSERDSAHLRRFGVVSRRVSLPLDYIERTKNVEVLDGRAVAVATPTSLAASAARQALARAGIGVESIGLVIADTATPHQTCPSEAQRIAGALGIKVPAYDVIGGTASLPLYVEMLSSWKPERVPDYVLCVSTNTPSQHVSYASDVVESHLYGDAAAALVISPRHDGKLTLVDSYLERRGFLASTSVVKRHISVSRESFLPRAEVQGMIEQGLRRSSEKSGGQKTLTKVIGPQLYSGEFPDYESALGLERGTLISGSAQSGYALGSSCGVALSSVWDSIAPGERVAILHVGDGMWSGSVLLGSE